MYVLLETLLAEEPRNQLNYEHLKLHQPSHAAYYVPTQMALAHNGILRGLNAIYIQAAHIPRDDHNAALDFLTYCQCWCKSMHHHHDAEETIFFPSIEAIADRPGLMERYVEYYRAFTPGFDRFQEHARTCRPTDYDSGGTIGRLIDEFAEPLMRHLHDEIETLRALDMYDSRRIRTAYRRFEMSLMTTDNVKLKNSTFLCFSISEIIDVH